MYPFNRIRLEIIDWVESALRNTPGAIGKLMRRIYWARKFRQCRSVSINEGCVIKGAENISLGDEVVLSYNCRIYAHNNGDITIKNRTKINENVIISASENGKITIGNDVLIGPNVVIRASNHNFEKRNVPIVQQGHAGGEILIEDDVWLGANVAVLPNAVIKKGAVIGAGAVVNKEVPSYSLSAGVPAKVIRENCRV